jgi:hypothetical protein
MTPHGLQIARQGLVIPLLFPTRRRPLAPLFPSIEMSAPVLLRSLHRALQDAELMAKSEHPDLKSGRVRRQSRNTARTAPNIEVGVKKWMRLNSQCINKIRILGNHT